MGEVREYRSARHRMEDRIVELVAAAEADGSGVVVFVGSILGLTPLWHRLGASAYDDLFARVLDEVVTQAPTDAHIEQVGEAEIAVVFPGGHDDGRHLRRRISAALAALQLDTDHIGLAAGITVGPDAQVVSGDLLWDVMGKAVRARVDQLQAGMTTILGSDPRLDQVVPRVLQFAIDQWGVGAAGIEVGDDRSWILPHHQGRPPDRTYRLATGSRRVGRYLAWSAGESANDRMVEETLYSIAVALERGLNLDQAEERARHDALTGLLNRDGLARAMEVAPLPCALAIVDIDHFKAMNDRYGHAAGDEMLVALASLLRAGRSSDLVARWGGEEIVVIMPRTTAEGAAAALRRLLVEAMATIGVGDMALSFSAGVVELTDEGPVALAEAVGAADQAMYAAKRAGRRRVFVSPAGPTTVDSAGALEPPGAG